MYQLLHTGDLMKYLLLLLLVSCGQSETTWSNKPVEDTKPVLIPPGKDGPGECTTPPILVKVPLTQEDVDKYIKDLCSKECDITKHYGYVIHMKKGSNIGEGCFCKKKLR